jgi:hypothetical protein
VPNKSRGDARVRERVRWVMQNHGLTLAERQLDDLWEMGGLLVR